MLGKNYIWNYLQQLLEVNYYYHYGTITRKNLYIKKKSMNTDYNTYWRSQLQKKYIISAAKNTVGLQSQMTIAYSFKK
jgi:hypothetical protein